MTDKQASVHIPPKGTRGASMPGGALVMRLAGPLMKRRIAGYQRATGPEAKTFMGFPLLLLTTVGAKTGKEHTHILGGFPDGAEAWLIVASKGGAATHPAWFINLAKTPEQVWVQIGNRKFQANVESLRGAEREQAYARVVKVAPQYGSYLKKTDREIPVIRVTPAK